MALWLLIIRPFKTRGNLFINTSNEFLLFIIFGTLYLLQRMEAFFIHGNTIGWIMIGLVCFAILQSWVIMFPIMVKTFKDKCCGKKKKLEEEKKESVNNIRKK